MTHLSELVIASHNAGKVRELEALVASLGVRVYSATEMILDEPEETGDTFEANAALKAEAAAAACGKASLADDSGLCVVALNDDPGIYSARWGGDAKDFNLAMDKVRAALEAKGEKPEGAAAYFVCVLALSIPDTPTQFFRGEVHGTLTFPARGKRGFGYDPIFVANHDACPKDQTFAEIDPELKARISHRAQAFEKFLAYLK
jgi:XTP/dITP diphosphohydrolase